MLILRDWRKMHDVTQAVMAGAIGVHVSTLSQLEHGRCRPGVPVLCRIWRYTGLSADALLRACMGEQPTGTGDSDAGEKPGSRGRRQRQKK